MDRQIKLYSTLNIAEAICSYAEGFDQNSNSFFTQSASYINVSIQVLFTLVLHLIKKEKKITSGLYNFRIGSISSGDLD